MQPDQNQPVVNPYAAPPPPPVQAPVQPTITPAAVEPDLSSQLTTEIPPEPKRGLPKMLLLFVGLILVLLVVFLLSRVFLGKKKTTTSKTTEITWWGLWEEERVVKPLIDEYQTKNPEVKINYIRNSPQDYRERLVNALAKGTGPDIFRFHNTWLPMLDKELDAVPTTVMSSTEFSQSYFPVIAADAAKGSGFVGLPLGYEALTLYINEDIFSQEGVSPPDTWIELRDVAKKLTKIENEQIVRAGVALGRTENVDHWQDIIGLMLIQNRVDLKKPEGKKAEDALKFFSVFSAVDNVWDETLPPSTQAFASGKVAMYFGPSWRALNIKELNSNLKFKTVPLPQLPKENPNEPDIGYASYWLEGVWTKSKNKDLAWNFLKFISSKESLEKLYREASNSRGLGVAYPRTDMKEMLAGHSVLGSIVELAPTAQSWYLASRTYDGPTGINSQIAKYFEDAINAINGGTLPNKALEPVTKGVVQVLQQYGLIK